MNFIKTFATSLLLLITISLTAQQGINYKALIKDGGGNVIANQSVTVQFQVLQGAGMLNVYQETHTPNTDENGFVIINIGEGSIDSGVYTDIDWGSDDHFLNVQIDTGGGLTDMGCTQFMAVPYALSAKTADNVTETQTLANVAALGNSANSQIKNLTNPTEPKDAVNKEYVDALIAALDARLTILEPHPAAIGDLRAGGVVFWVDPSDNTHGLVCALSDYVSNKEWGCYGTDLPSVPNVISGPPTGPGAEIGDGINNTNGILIDCPEAPAALAASSVGSEWFLPSAKELNEIYLNEATLEAVSGVSPFSGVY